MNSCEFLPVMESFGSFGVFLVIRVRSILLTVHLQVGRNFCPETTENKDI